MARPLRIEYDGAVYHITSRGNARKSIYKEDEDRRIFLEVLHRAKTRYNWLCQEATGSSLVSCYLPGLLGRGSPFLTHIS